MKSLDFEKPLDDLYQKIDELKQLSDEANVDLTKDISAIEARAEEMKTEIYASLTPAQIIQIARHPNRPNTLSLARMLCDDFNELKGDRSFRDDPSIVGGIGKLGPFRAMIIGHQKGADTKEKIKRNFGMPHPEGYRKALRLMKMADKFKMPIVTFVDTPGAYPGKEAEERGQAEAIARNLKEMIGIEVPIITVVIGEGGSGGALGIAVANRILMLEYAVYSVISPEGCASILFRDASRAEYAAEKLKMTAKDIVDLGIADQIIPEPLGGAHNNWDDVAKTIKLKLVDELENLMALDTAAIKNQRFEKFRSFGKFKDPTAKTS
ncbi:MAG: acetyl-CoA carboxylase carboxyltransferase subunit alpha [Candidatus Marinamargulisbacteria bacterium]